MAATVSALAVLPEIGVLEPESSMPFGADLGIDEPFSLGPRLYLLYRDGSAISRIRRF